MAHIDINAQVQVYTQAQQSLESILDKEMLSWDFNQMIKALKHAIRTTRRPKERHSIRYFARNYLGFRDEKYQEVRGWFSGTKEMSFEDIVSVLRKIREIRCGAPKPETLKEVAVGANTETSCQKAAVDHAIGQINLASALLTNLGVTPRDVLDGQRMIVIKRLMTLCSTLGVEVRFPVSRKHQGRPVTASDLG